MSDEEGDEEEGATKGPKWPVTVFIAEGNMQYRRGEYQKAIDNYDIVLEREPTHVKILVQRSKCNHRLQRYDLAMQDALDALKLDPKSIIAICQKGEIEFAIGDFEFAYLTFQRGFQRRPNYRQLTLGMQKCEDAILNTIGPNSGLRITDEDIEAVEERLQAKHTEFYSGRKAHKKAQETPSTSSDTKYKSKILLQDASQDKSYFEKLMPKPPHLAQIAQPEDARVRDDIILALDYFKDRQQFWQMNKPWHSKKKVKCTLRVPVENFRKKKAPTSAKDVHEEALYRIELANSYLEDGDCEKSIEICSELLKLIKTMDTLEDRSELIARTLEIMGWAEQDMNHLNLAIRIHEREKEVAWKDANEDELLGSLVNLGQDYLLAGKYKESMADLEEALPMAEFDIERAYILRNMCSCHLGLQNRNAAKESGRRALELAETIGQKDLQVEVCLLLAKAEGVEQCNNAFSYYEKALELLVDLGDEDKEREVKETMKTFMDLMTARDLNEKAK